MCTTTDHEVVNRISFASVLEWYLERICLRTQKFKYPVFKLGVLQIM